MKTSELTGRALDWAIAKCLGKENTWGKSSLIPYDYHMDYRYSTDWSQGGPIIEQEGFTFHQWGKDGEWEASYPDWQKREVPRTFGPNHLIAAMRCFVASKLGDEVDIPEELL